MGEAQGGQGAIPPGELGQVVQRPHQLIPDQGQPLPHEDDVGVVPHIAAGGPQVDDGHGLGALGAKGVDVGHDVVAQLLLLLGRQFIVNVGEMGLHLVNLLLGDGQAQLHLRPGQRHPQLAPGGKLLVRGKQVLHLIAGIPG